MMKKRAKNLVSGMIRKLLVESTDWRREMYSRFRKLGRGPEIRKRTEIASELNSKFTIPPADGFAIFNEEDFPAVAEVCSQATSIVKNSDLDRDRTNRKKQLYTGLLKSELLDIKNPVLELALDRNLLSVISSYLGCLPILTGADVWYSKSSPELSNSQLFHCDWAAISQIKVFSYATHVTDMNGPLTIIPAAKSAEIRRKLVYKYGQKISDEAIFEIVDPKDQIPIVGKPGTIALVDTSRCFHFGSRVSEESDPRILTMLQFMKPTDFRFLELVKLPFENFKVDGLTELQQMVLGNA